MIDANAAIALPEKKTWKKNRLFSSGVMAAFATIMMFKGVSCLVSIFIFLLFVWCFPVFFVCLFHSILSRVPYPTNCINLFPLPHDSLTCTCAGEIEISPEQNN